MGNFQRRIFSTPGMGAKQFPAVLSDANLRTAGFAQWNVATGFVDPFTGLANYEDDIMIPVNAGPLFPLMLGEYAPAFLPAWAPSLIARRNFCSSLFHFQAVGFEASVVADVPAGWFEMYPWNGGIPGGISVNILFTGAAWEIQYSLGGGGSVTAGTLANFVDVCNNVIKINCTRVTANQKSFTITYWDSATATWVTSAPIVLNGAGLGDGIMIADWAPQSVEQGLTSSTLTSYCGLKNLVSQATDIDHTAFVLPQM